MISYEYIGSPSFWVTETDLVLGLGHYKTHKVLYTDPESKIHDLKVPIKRVLVGCSGGMEPLSLPPWYFFTVTDGLFSHEA